MWHIASASQGLQPLVFHSLTLMDVQAALDQAGVFTLPRGLCAGRTELQRWVAPCVQWHLDFGPSLQQCSPHRLLFTTWGLQTQQYFLKATWMWIKQTGHSELPKLAHPSPLALTALWVLLWAPCHYQGSRGVTVMTRPSLPFLEPGLIQAGRAALPHGVHPPLNACPAAWALFPHQPDDPKATVPGAPDLHRQEQDCWWQQGCTAAAD